MPLIIEFFFSEYYLIIAIYITNFQNGVKVANTNLSQELTLLVASQCAYCKTKFWQARLCFTAGKKNINFTFLLALISVYLKVG